MAKPKFDVAKGMKDWYGKDAIIRNQIRNTLRNIFEKYGFVPIETPMVETRKALGFKGGGEIQKEVFLLKDQGGREIALRFDQTVPLARFTASHKDIKFPFKRYVIGEVFRDGPTQPEQGRYRSFTQCDVDILGVKEMAAEAELFALAQDAFRELGLGNVEVKINNRKLLEGLLDYAGVPDYAKLRTISTLDRADKIGLDGVREELLELTAFSEEMSLSNEILGELFDKYKERGISVVKSPEIKSKIVAEVDNQGYQDILSFFETEEDQSELYAKVEGYKTQGQKLLNPKIVEEIMEAIQLGGGNEETYQRLSKIISSPKGREGLTEIRQLLDYSAKMGLDFIQFDPCLARGLDYYTGTTIEVYLQDRNIVRSAILAGGRFDDMVGDFRGGEEIPAVGFSFGLERLVMVLKDYKKDSKKTNTEIYLIPIGKTTDECLGIAHRLRNQGLNVDMELQHRKKVGQSINYAESLGIPYVALVGEDEIKEDTITLKNLEARTQEKVKTAAVYNCLRGNE
ncbi:hypothetical protein GOV06_00040 [Candidatus Woesearchaeota archaeon]|nr:hypothetical protein [Candidatus Woesearchaeota archaeon]